MTPTSRSPSCRTRCFRSRSATRRLGSGLSSVRETLSAVSLRARESRTHRRPLAAPPHALAAGVVSAPEMGRIRLIAATLLVLALGATARPGARRRSPPGAALSRFTPSACRLRPPGAAGQPLRDASWPPGVPTRSAASCSACPARRRLPLCPGRGRSVRGDGVLRRVPRRDPVCDRGFRSGYGYLTTRDGTKLAIDVRLPAARPYPTLIEYSGYGYADPAGPRAGSARSRPCWGSRSST